ARKTPPTSAEPEANLGAHPTAAAARALPIPNPPSSPMPRPIEAASEPNQAPWRPAFGTAVRLPGFDFPGGTGPPNVLVPQGHRVSATQRFPKREWHPRDDPVLETEGPTDSARVDCPERGPERPPNPIRRGPAPDPF